MKYSPVIIVVAYNRPKSLKRILSSLYNAKNIKDVKLIISIDNKEPDNKDVLDIANEFDWRFGEKEVIYQPVRMGLRKHILQCGDLALKYDSAIILEDDLYVAPYFYQYAVNALEYYDHDDRIAGISLYSQPREDITEFPFTAINDDSDIFFMQFPSSWGIAWSAKQWVKFRDWYHKTPDILKLPVSAFILNWPESSWKKYFVSYLVDTDKYFVFPRISLTTNFNDPGTHYESLVNFDGQAALQLNDFHHRFKKLSDSNCVYDSHYELLTEKVKLLNPELKEYSFEMDLYGHKNIHHISTPFMITSKRVRSYIRSFGRSLKPHDSNIILNLPGDDFVLCKTSDVLPYKHRTRKEVLNFKYFYTRHLPGKNVLLFKFLTKYKFFSFLDKI
jgi:hypothetical protein